jgi:serine/threonine-protein kinase
MNHAALTEPTCDRHLVVRREPSSVRALIADRYQLVRRLGRGGMGEVLLADDLVLERPVAIKRSRAAEHDGPYGRKLRREARIAARIAHRSIVQVYDLVQDAGADHLVMELVDGPTLLSMHDAGRVDPVEVVRIAIELAAGLSAVHARGALHLDVKLENVLVAPDGQPKLTDFGIARCARELDVGGVCDEHVVGTPRCMSPEQIQGEPDARSDLYSVGVMMFELLAGESPFSGATELHTLSRILGEDAPRVDAYAHDLPPALAELVADLLQKSPALRPQTALELQVRLWAIAAGLE